MANIGDIKRGPEIGKKTPGKFIFGVCEICGQARWVRMINGQLMHKLCGHCCQTFENNNHWKGGRKVSGGYIFILLRPGDFFYPMTNKSGYVLEHRLVVAKALNRCLLRWEVVHHKNGIKDDNRFENLELLPTRKYHLVDNVMKATLSRLEKEICQLRRENKEQQRLIIWMLREVKLATVGKSENG